MRLLRRALLHRGVLFATFVFALALMASTGTAVVIRHDKDDAVSLRLASRFEAVARMLPDGACTLIAPTWVLTAAHVAASLSAETEVQFGQKRYRVKRTVLHPQSGGPSGMPPEVDLGLIELAEPVDGIQPVELYRGDQELGRMLFIVGYGDYGNPRSGLQRTDGRRRAATNTVDDAGPIRLFMRFDEPPKGSEYEGVGGPGDSGGPALFQENGQLFLVGVSSASMNGKPGEYGLTDVYARVSTQVDWIEKTIGGK